MKYSCQLNRTIFFILLIFSTLEFSAQSQNDHLKNALHKLNKIFEFEVVQKTIETPGKSINKYKKQTAESYISVSRKIDQFESILQRNTLSSDDTLFIGDTPGETLVINGTWVYNGAIVVFNDGVLEFNNADATILGDLICAGNSHVIMNASSIHFPQEFFYQRTWLMLENSIMDVTDCSIDFGGLVHSMAVAHNASINMTNNLKPDFSTVSMLHNGSFTIDQIDMAGEFIADDSTFISISNAETVLIWHQFDSVASVTFEFPDGDHINNYSFNNNTSGVSGIGYDVKLNNCDDVMWGLMPSSGSDITISNSDLRTIGLWFVGNDSIEVSGLVNNSTYQDFTANIPDRNLHLINCDLMTWSLYCFQDAHIDITGCLVGEIGMMGRSMATGIQYAVDGSGGYVFVGDTTAFFSYLSPFLCSLRTTGNGIAIYAYSSLVNGMIAALDQSILILAQVAFNGSPIIGEKACLWNSLITGPVNGYSNTQIDITGSAWIDKGPQSLLMDFSHYNLYYNSLADTSWKVIAENITTEVRDDILYSWDATGIEPGNYNIKLELHSDVGFSSDINYAITVLPEFMEIGEANDEETFSIYPNPVTDILNINLTGWGDQEIFIQIMDSRGNFVYAKKLTSFSEKTFQINCRNYSSGLYFLRIRTTDMILTKKFVVR